MLDPQERHPFLQRVALEFGVTESDLRNFDTFAKRLLDMTTYAHERNCVLYVDAEQTYM
jgi:hypothetical protein